jgi:hypothetical protein
MGPGGVIIDSKVLGSSGSTGTGLPQSTMRLSTPGSEADPSGQARADGRTPNRPVGNTGGAIAGVASMSEEASIRIWNDQTTYDMWEFIYNFRTDPIAMAGPLGQQQQPPGQPQGQGQTQGQVPPNQQQPPGFPPGQTNPFGGGPTGPGSLPGRGAPIGIPPVPDGSPNQPGLPRRF